MAQKFLSWFFRSNVVTPNHIWVCYVSFDAESMPLSIEHKNLTVVSYMPEKNNLKFSARKKYRKKIQNEHKQKVNKFFHFYFVFSSRRIYVLQNAWKTCYKRVIKYFAWNFFVCMIFWFPNVRCHMATPGVIGYWFFWHLFGIFFYWFREFFMAFILCCFGVFRIIFETISYSTFKWPVNLRWKKHWIT